MDFQQAVFSHIWHPSWNSLQAIFSYVLGGVFNAVWGSWKIKVLEQNHTKKHVFSTVDFNGIFKGRIDFILRVLIFTGLVLGC